MRMFKICLGMQSIIIEIARKCYGHFAHDDMFVLCVCVWICSLSAVVLIAHLKYGDWWEYLAGALKSGEGKIKCKTLARFCAMIRIEVKRNKRAITTTNNTKKIRRNKRTKKKNSKKRWCCWNEMCRMRIRKKLDAWTLVATRFAEFRNSLLRIYSNSHHGDFIIWSHLSRTP